MDSQYSPSFSSSLLDSIYRSIDHGDDKMLIYREAIRNSNARARTRAAAAAAAATDEEMANFRRACMIEKWMEKKATEKAVVRRKSAADSHTKKPRKSDRPPSSSWSAAAGERDFFSSSEPESLPLPRPNPVRTGMTGFGKDPRPGSDPKHEAGGFLKTKSRALKIYGDLKKVKQPISPGGKLAGFLNIFTGAGKSKIQSPSLKSANALSTCSSASSFSRSCLSKTPSSRGKSSNGAKRSVRFSEVDEDCGHNKSLLRNELTSRFDGHDNRIRNVINEELMVHVMEKNQVARDLLRNYQMKTQTGRSEFEFPSFDNSKKSNVKSEAFDRDFDEDDDDDAASYASSDLFELDNLSAIGNMERYREELPVYESTRLDRANRAGGLVF